MAQSKFVGFTRWAVAGVLFGGLAVGLGTANAALSIKIAIGRVIGPRIMDPEGPCGK